MKDLYSSLLSSDVKSNTFIRIYLFLLPRQFIVWSNYLNLVVIHVKRSIIMTTREAKFGDLSGGNYS